MSDSLPPPLDRDPDAPPELRRAVALLKQSAPRGYDPEANWEGIAAELARLQKRRSVELWVLLAAALILGMLAAVVRWPDSDITSSPPNPPADPRPAIAMVLGVLAALVAGVGLGRFWRSRG